MRQAGRCVVRFFDLLQHFVRRSEEQETLQLGAVRRRAAPVDDVHLPPRARRRGADAARLPQPEARAHHRHLAVVADEHRGGTEHARGDARDVPLARYRDDDQKHHRVLAPRKPVLTLHHPLVQKRRPDEQKQTPDERLGDVRERRGAHEQRTDVRQSARDPRYARRGGAHAVRDLRGRQTVVPDETAAETARDVSGAGGE